MGTLRDILHPRASAGWRFLEFAAALDSSVDAVAGGW